MDIGNTTYVPPLPVPSNGYDEKNYDANNSSINFTDLSRKRSDELVNDEEQFYDASGDEAASSQRITKDQNDDIDQFADTEYESDDSSSRIPTKPHLHRSHSHQNNTSVANDASTERNDCSTTEVDNIAIKNGTIKKGVTSDLPNSRTNDETRDDKVDKTRDDEVASGSRNVSIEEMSSGSENNDREVTRDEKFNENNVNKISNDDDEFVTHRTVEKDHTKNDEKNANLDSTSPIDSIEKFGDSNDDHESIDKIVSDTVANILKNADFSSDDESPNNFIHKKHSRIKRTSLEMKTKNNLDQNGNVGEDSTATKTDQDLLEFKKQSSEYECWIVLRRVNVEEELKKLVRAKSTKKQNNLQSKRKQIRKLSKGKDDVENNETGDKKVVKPTSLRNKRGIKMKIKKNSPVHVDDESFEDDDKAETIPNPTRDRCKTMSKKSSRTVKSPLVKTGSKKVAVPNRTQSKCTKIFTVVEEIPSPTIKSPIKKKSSEDVMPRCTRGPRKKLSEMKESPSRKIIRPSSNETNGTSDDDDDEIPLSRQTSVKPIKTPEKKPLQGATNSVVASSKKKCAKISSSRKRNLSPSTTSDSSPQQRSKSSRKTSTSNNILPRNEGSPIAIGDRYVTGICLIRMNAEMIKTYTSSPPQGPNADKERAFRTKSTLQAKRRRESNDSEAENVVKFSSDEDLREKSLKRTKRVQKSKSAPKAKKTRESDNSETENTGKFSSDKSFREKSRTITKPIPKSKSIPKTKKTRESTDSEAENAAKFSSDESLKRTKRVQKLKSVPKAKKTRESDDSETENTAKFSSDKNSREKSCIKTKPNIQKSKSVPKAKRTRESDDSEAANAAKSSSDEDFHVKPLKKTKRIQKPKSVPKAKRTRESDDSEVENAAKSSSDEDFREKLPKKTKRIQKPKSIPKAKRTRKSDDSEAENAAKSSSDEDFCEKSPKKTKRIQKPKSVPKAKKTRESDDSEAENAAKSSSDEDFREKSLKRTKRIQRSKSIPKAKKTRISDDSEAENAAKSSSDEDSRAKSRKKTKGIRKSTTISDNSSEDNVRNTFDRTLQNKKISKGKSKTVDERSSSEERKVISTSKSVTEKKLASWPKLDSDSDVETRKKNENKFDSVKSTAKNEPIRIKITSDESLWEKFIQSETKRDEKNSAENKKAEVNSCKPNDDDEKKIVEDEKKIVEDEKPKSSKRYSSDEGSTYHQSDTPSSCASSKSPETNKTTKYNRISRRYSSSSENERITRSRKISDDGCDSRKLKPREAKTKVNTAADNTNFSDEESDKNTKNKRKSSPASSNESDWKSKMSIKESAESSSDSSSDIEESLKKKKPRGKIMVRKKTPVKRRTGRKGKPNKHEETLKKMVILCGLRIFSYNQFWGDCDTVEEKTQRIHEFLREKGLKDKPTLHNCKKFGILQRKLIAAHSVSNVTDQHDKNCDTTNSVSKEEDVSQKRPTWQSSGSE